MAKIGSAQRRPSGRVEKQEPTAPAVADRWDAQRDHWRRFRRTEEERLFDRFRAEHSAAARLRADVGRPARPAYRRPLTRRRPTLTVRALLDSDHVDRPDVRLLSQEVGRHLCQRLRDLAAQVRLAAGGRFEGVEDAVRRVPELERLPRHRAVLGDCELTPGFEERGGSSPLPRLASSKASSPSEMAM